MELAGRLLAEREELSFAFTTSAATRPDGTEDIFRLLVPDDNVPAVGRFLDHWKPDIGVWTEPELRPALMTEAVDRGVPLYLFDAGSARPDAQSWRWYRGMSASLLERFQTVITGDTDVATTLQLMGMPGDRLEVSGFLEEATPAPPCNEAERDRLAKVIGGRPVWTAIGVTQAECDASIAAHLFAERKAHRLLLIMVPQDPGDGEVWAKTLREQGIGVALRSEDEDPEAEVQVLIADEAGELGLWLRLAQITFLGQSLDDGGGVSPHGAAALGSAILFGQNVKNHAAAYAKYEAGDAARRVRDAKALGQAVEETLSPATAAKMAHAAWNVSSAGAEVTDRAIDLVLAELDDI